MLCVTQCFAIISSPFLSAVYNLLDQNQHYTYTPETILRILPPNYTHTSNYVIKACETLPRPLMVTFLGKERKEQKVSSTPTQMLKGKAIIFQQKGRYFLRPKLYNPVICPHFRHLTFILLEILILQQFCVTHYDYVVLNKLFMFYLHCKPT